MPASYDEGSSKPSFAMLFFPSGVYQDPGLFPSSYPSVSSYHGKEQHELTFPVCSAIHNPAFYPSL